MKRREFIALVGGAGAALFAIDFPRATLAQDAADWVTAFPRAPVHIAAWPAGRKVAVGFALFIEEFGFGQGPVFRPDLASRNPDLVNEAFRQYAIDWGIPRVGRLFKELDVPLTVVLNAEFPPKHASLWLDYVLELAAEARADPAREATTAVIGIHPFVIGTPDGAAALRRVLSRLKKDDQVWLTDTDAILKAAGLK